ncbi:MAG: GH1 family beta-glucosidase [Phycisphaerales bacterium]
MPFPTDFVWGAASSAYQIEGAWDADGKAPSVWDEFTHASRDTSNIFGHHTADVACDHYHRYAQDVGLMRQIGLRAYRFSVSWPRVIPAPGARPNPAGLDFYSRLVDSLLAAGIAPWLTLFHWDLPLWAYHRGGWLNRDISGWFAEYAQAVVAALSDRVGHWITINEPQIFLGPSECEGVQTSGARKSHAERLLAAHHALLAHGRGVQAIRSALKRPAQVGWAPIGRVKAPATDSPEDLDAARRATLGVLARDFWNNTWFADPVVLGRYPEDGLRLYGSDVPEACGSARDLETIRQPIDFYGINVYDAERYRAAAGGRLEKVEYPPGHPRTAIGWYVDEDALYFGPKFLYERYKVPLVITENGMSSHDWVDLDGRVRDAARIDYTRRYLRALRRAIDDGADVRGYFHWSIMDNFEWQQGFKERFGLIHIDYSTQKRTLKDSANWYARVIQTNGASLDSPAGPA